MKKYLTVLLILGGSTLVYGSSTTEPVALPEMKAVATYHSALVQHVMPEYPFELRRSGETGRVSLDIVVDQEGRVAAVKVLDSDNYALAEAARDAVRQWRFVPEARDALRDVRHARITFSFELEERA